MKRLIEQELPIARVNAESAREKSLRHGNISTMHLWWARRTLAQSRAIVAGTMIADPEREGEREELLACLASVARFEASNDDSYLGPLRSAIRRSNGGEPPKVLDCVAGGGAIPLEALRLGCDTTALELNPVAHLIERCVLEYPQRYGQMDAAGRNPLAEDFLRWSAWVRRYAEERLVAAFPGDERGRRPAVFFWARTMRCPNAACGIEIPLVTSRWLANSSRKVWLRFTPRPGTLDVSVVTGHPPPDEDPKVGTSKRSSATCPACSTSSDAGAVRRYARDHGLGRRLLAVLEVDQRHRTYRAPSGAEVDAAERAGELLDSLEELEGWDVAGPGRGHGQVAIPALQQPRLRHRHLGWPFQRAPAARPWDTLPGGARRPCSHARCGRVARPGTSALDVPRLHRRQDRRLQLVVCLMGAKRRIPARHTFPRQAIAMVWDYVETYPFHHDGGIWDGHTRWIELTVRHCSAAANATAEVVRGNAQELPFDDAHFDAVIVDPPYYDAFQYGDLSDFFYVWLKRSVGPLYPELFTTPLTPKRQEIIESRADKQSPEFISHDEFEERLQKALQEMARVTKPNGVVAIVFAHTDVEAWERLLRGLQAANLVVSTSWPMHSERSARMTAQISATLDSSVVLDLPAARERRHGLLRRRCSRPRSTHLRAPGSL